MRKVELVAVVAVVAVVVVVVANAAVVHAGMLSANRKFHIKNKHVCVYIHMYTCVYICMYICHCRVH